jgi:hypothetical protein
VELGRINIMAEVSFLSSHLCLPSEGHLDVLYHMFAHLVLNHNARVVFDLNYPDIAESAFINTDWKAMYGDVKEVVPIDVPTNLGEEVDSHLYVDYDHAREKFTRHSRSGFMIFLNMAPIVWFSKQQTTVEMSVFGAEFVVMNNDIETVLRLRYKL